MGRKATIDQLRNRIREMESSPVEQRGRDGDGGESFGSTAVKFQTFSEAEVLEKKTPSVSRDETPDARDGEGAFKKIVALMNASDKPERVLRQRLAQAGFEADSIDEAIERARSYGIIDDIRYADVLIRSRVSQGRGMRGIERELDEQGISVYDVPGWPFEYDLVPENEFSRALDVLKRNPPRAKNKRDAAYRKLVQRGYDSSTASSAARAWSEAGEQR